MCFTKNQSYINFILLTLGAIYVYPRKELSATLFFLGIKDLIQARLYHNIELNNKKSVHILTVLSWIHICFQPLFVNIFMSHFDQTKKDYWNRVFFICLIYGLHTLTTLNEFDIQNDKDCVKKNDKQDFCSKRTESYIGKYHVGYKFSRDKDDIWMPILYFVLMLIPALFTKSYKLILLWTLCIFTLFKILNVGSGERSAIWCFLSIIYVLPISVITKIKPSIFL